MNIYVCTVSRILPRRQSVQAAGGKWSSDGPHLIISEWARSERDFQDERGKKESNLGTWLTLTQNQLFADTHFVRTKVTKITEPDGRSVIGNLLSFYITTEYIVRMPSKKKKKYYDLAESTRPARAGGQIGWSSTDA
jgi:hypothetical protein